MTADKFTASDLCGLLRARHEASAGWHVLEQVRNGTGWQKQTRTADAFAIQTFPSRGICAHGFEVKVARNDLVKELREPKKADAIQRWCSYWWLVVSSPELLADLVLPETWGVLVVKKGKLAVHRDAPKLEPEPWSPAFVAALVRAFQDGMVPKREVDDLRAQIHAEVEKRVAERLPLEVQGAAYDTESLRGELKQLKADVEKFEAASGVRITQWRWGDVGAAVQALMEMQNSRPVQLRALERDAQELLDRARAVREAVEKLHAEPA